jgi:peroxiredoxin
MKYPRILFCLAIILAFSTLSFGQKGKPVAEDFTAVSLNGQTINLESLKGKVVVLTFWSTRCDICISEIPKLNGLVNSYRGKDVVFLGLTVDNPAKVEGFLKRKPFNFNILPNSFGVVLKYADKDSSGNINMAFPTHFLVNQDGEIDLKTNGFDKTDVLNSRITRLLASKHIKVE